MRFPLLLAGLILSFTLSGANKKPNILMIAIDDQNDWTGYLGGHPMIKTPISTGWPSAARPLPMPIASRPYAIPRARA